MNLMDQLRLSLALIRAYPSVSAKSVARLPCKKARNLKILLVRSLEPWSDLPLGVHHTACLSLPISVTLFPLLTILSFPLLFFLSPFSSSSLSLSVSSFLFLYLSKEIV